MPSSGFNPNARWDRPGRDRSLGNASNSFSRPATSRQAGSRPLWHSLAGGEICPVIRNSEPGSLNGRIEVLSWFRNGRISPRAFIWNKKFYRVKEITYRWQERLGQAVISYFSVRTSANLYQISFNNTSYSWRIDKVID